MPKKCDALDAILSVLADAGQLKTLKRAGWQRVGLPDPESVADHSFRLAFLALLIGPRLGLNVEAMLRLALVHDLGEARIGDLTPADRVSSAEKRARESEALAQILDDLPEGPALFSLWREYASGATPEARIVRQLDKLEMAIQALEYENRTGRDLTEFWLSARASLAEPLLVELYERLWSRRRVTSGGVPTPGD
jgi:5'-deoxynucleotidase YfbR-like HD superfamily hydrolase